MVRMFILVTAMVSLAFPSLLPAAEEGFIEGTHYVELAEARPTRAEEGEVEVIEFFWYGCPHCYAAERHIKKWLQEKPDAVKFLRVPATLNRGWLLHARAFYTAERLNISNEMHDALFHAIHRERKALTTIDDIAALFEEKAGVDKEQFRQAFESFPVGNKLMQADALARTYPLSGVPSIVVAGKYLTTAGMAGSYKRLLDITRYLTARELGGETPGETPDQTDAIATQ